MRRTRTRTIAMGLLAIAFYVGASAAQTETADQLLAKAKAVRASDGPTAALPEYEKALDAYRSEKNRLGEAITLGLIGNCYKNLGDHKRALDLLNQALQMKQELHASLEEGKTLSNIGLVYWDTGEYPKATDFFKRAIALAREIHDRQLEAAALNNLALVYDEEGDFTKSLPQYEEALALHRQVKYAEGQADTLSNIGGVYLLLGRFDKASEYYEQALAINERLGRKPSASQDLGNLAACQAALGKLEESLGTFDRALSLAQEAGLKKEEADWKKGKANTLLRLGKYDAALAEYRAALESYEAAGLKSQLVEALNDDGYAHLMLGDSRSAEQAFQRAIQIAKQISLPRGVMTNTLAMADLRWRTGDYKEASSFASEALRQAEKLDDSVDMVTSLTVLASALRDQGHTTEALAKSRAAIVTAKKTGSPLVQAQAYENEAEILLRLNKAAAALAAANTAGQIAAPTGDTVLPWHIGYIKGQALELLKRDDEAVDAYETAIKSVESIRSSIAEDRFRTGFLEDKQKVYVALVRLLVRLGRTGEAFQYSERLRSHAYLDLFDRSTSHSDNAQAVELRARIRRLQRAIEEENSKTVTEQRGDALKTFSTELAAAEREYSDMVATSPAAKPDARLLVPPVVDVQRAIPAHVAVIEYIVAEQQVALFVLTRDALHAMLVHVRSADLQSKIYLLRELIKQPGSPDWKLPAQSLRAILIAPAEKAGWLRGIDQISVIPHGMLHYLPFAALLRTGATGDRLLVDDYVISYLPAASTLASHHDTAIDAERLVAYAPESSKLRYTAGEVRSIASTFGSRGTAVIGRAATETSFKRNASDYDVIHFATHGFFNRSNPLFSGVELQPDAENDGRLEVHEILRLHLKAQLVTLSACDTAMGTGYFTEIPAGDEFVGLTRAFLSAGASTVAATLWEVNDSSTAQLMQLFYRGLTKHAPAQSLAAAQRAMLHGDAAHQHPYYWSAFIVVGSSGAAAPGTIAEKR